MRNSLLFATLAMAGNLFAGGFYLTLGNPEASPEARKAHAVLTMKATGCGEPWKAQLTAVAVGVVEGKRQEIPLKVTSLSEPGMFALTQQWPKDGKWVLHITANEKINGTPASTHTLVAAGPAGIDRLHAKSTYEKHFTASDIDAMLK
jgi:hypothetical protein